MIKPADIINFWYSDLMRKHWFSSTPEIDKTIRDGYEQVWIEAAAGAYDEWMNQSDGCLALTIILDQFPLNMFRGMPKAFQTERKAVEVALWALGKGFDKELSKDKLPFLLMPLMHSESLEHQELSVSLFRAHELKNNIRFSEHHRDIVKRFGRFPHRNEILGRESTREELEYLSSKDAFKG